MRPTRTLINKTSRILCTLAMMATVNMQGNTIYANEAIQEQSEDTQLGEALQFFYAEDYDKALPIFKSLGKKAETLDIMYWIGVCARNTGDYELSISNFKKILAADPQQHRIRLELADALIFSGKFDEATKELNIVKNANPPESVQISINTRLEKIKKLTQKGKWGGLLSQGLQYDDNISSGPDNASVDVVGGTLLLNNTQQKLDSYNWITKLGGYYRYDPGQHLGLVWNTKANIYNSSSTESSQFNYLMMDASTGPWFVNKESIVKLPVGYTHYTYGNEHLADAFHFDPSIEYFFDNTFSVLASYKLDYANYSETKIAGNDHTQYMLSIGPNWYLNNRKHIIAGKVSFENNNADLDRNSYETRALTFSYFTKFTPQVEMNLFWRIFERNYDAAALLYTEKREDIRQVINANTTYRFKDHYFATLEYTHVNNNSNSSLYEFDKNLYTVSIGVNY